MPSVVHEMLVEMVRARPVLVAELLTDALGMDLPAYQGSVAVSGGVVGGVCGSRDRRLVCYPDPAGVFRCLGDSAGGGSRSGAGGH
ncbi:MAG: hypothetical protein ACRDS0_16000 [Pseudonocardiaceae bacterium]